MGAATASLSLHVWMHVLYNTIARTIGQRIASGSGVGQTVLLPCVGMPLPGCQIKQPLTGKRVQETERDGIVSSQVNGWFVEWRSWTSAGTEELLKSETQYSAAICQRCRHENISESTLLADTIEECIKVQRYTTTS